MAPARACSRADLAPSTPSFLLQRPPGNTERVADLQATCGDHLMSTGPDAQIGG